MNSASRHEPSIQNTMTAPVALSAFFHILLFGITAFGLPYIAHDPMVISRPISVEIVSDTGEKSGKKSEASKPDTPKPKPTKADAKPSETRRKTPPKVTAEAPPDLTKPVAPEINDIAQKREVVPPKPLERQKIEKPKPKPKPEPLKKEEAKPAQKEQFQSLLKNLAPDSESLPPEAESASAPPETAIRRLGELVTESEAQRVQRQLSGCWNVPAGAKFAEDLQVKLALDMKPDGTVARAVLQNQLRYNTDSHFRAAADAALRAVRNPRCSPLKLPPEKYHQWQKMIVTFTPADML